MTPSPFEPHPAHDQRTGQHDHRHHEPAGHIGEARQHFDAAAIVPTQRNVAEPRRRVDIGGGPRQCRDEERDEKGAFEGSVVVTALAAVDAGEPVTLHQRVLGVPQPSDHGQQDQIEVQEQHHRSHEDQRTPAEHEPALSVTLTVAVDERERQGLVQERHQEDEAHHHRESRSVGLDVANEQDHGHPTKRHRKIDRGTVHPSPLARGRRRHLQPVPR